MANPNLNIVYEDENILLVDKKPGVLCHSAGEWSWNTLIANIQARAYQSGEWRPREENSTGHSPESNNFQRYCLQISSNTLPI